MSKNRSLCPETLVRRAYKVLNRNGLFLRQSECSGVYRSAVDSAKGNRNPGSSR
jgi:hypothetical protein